MELFVKRSFVSKICGEKMHDNNILSLKVVWSSELFSRETTELFVNMSFFVKDLLW